MTQAEYEMSLDDLIESIPHPVGTTVRAASELIDLRAENLQMRQFMVQLAEAESADQLLLTRDLIRLFAPVAKDLDDALRSDGTAQARTE